MFWTQGDAEIARVSHFGQRQTLRDGEPIFQAGKPSPGMFVILSGRVAFTRRDSIARP